jgi:hypothetical protein
MRYLRLLTFPLIIGLSMIYGNGNLLAHTEGSTLIHEVVEEEAPQAKLAITKDPTGGFNVRVKSKNFLWRPASASMKHVNGEGHAHVYLDGRKIMRIYNQWFHLNTYQFATRAGNQLVSIEFVGNDHAPYTIQGVPLGAEQLIDVARDEIQPQKRGVSIPVVATSFLLLLALAAILRFRFSR